MLKRAQGTNEQVTFMSACNASGDFAPPMMIMPGKRIAKNVDYGQWLQANYAFTPNGKKIKKSW